MSDYVKKLITFFVFLGIVIAVQWMGNATRMPSFLDWYQTLHRPSWTPPNWLFAPVWTLLYIAIAWVGYRIWRAPRNRRRARALLFWSLQMLSNGLWSYLFFTRRDPRLAAIDLMVLVLVTVATTCELYKISKLAYVFFVVYLMWLIYALAINIAIAI